MAWGVGNATHVIKRPPKNNPIASLTDHRPLNYFRVDFIAMSFGNRARIANMPYRSTSGVISTEGRNLS